MTILYICIAVLYIYVIFHSIISHKKFKEQSLAIKIIEKNQIAISNSINSLNTHLQKMAKDTEKQYDNIKRTEALVVQKLNPLLEKNQIVDELRNKLRDSERTVTQLRSTILQMSTVIKRMSKQDKDEKKREAKPTQRRQRTQTK